MSTAQGSGLTVVERFAADYFVSASLTRQRQNDVCRALTSLEAHAGAPAEMLDDQAVRAWVTALVAGGLHVNTVRKHLHAVKPFFRWCWLHRVIGADEFMRIGTVTAPRGSSANARPRPYKRDEIARFWEELDARWPLAAPHMLRRFERGTSRYKRVYTHGMHLQIQAIASLALFGGLRATEIRLAAMDDLHPDNDFVVVRGKSPFGERQGFREVPYTEEGREYVGRWLEFREQLKPKHDDVWLVLNSRSSLNHPLLPSHPLNPVSASGFAGLLPTVGKGWELHRLRHTCATEWLRSGVELEQVSKLLGHASIGQTLGYAELVREDVQRGMRRVETKFVTAVGRKATHA